MRKLLLGIIWTVVTFLLFIVTSSGSAMVLEEMDYKAAIHNAQRLSTFDERYDYLVTVGENFIQQKRYSEARKIAEFVLNDLDVDSFAAKKILMISKLNRVAYE